MTGSERGAAFARSTQGAIVLILLLGVASYLNSLSVPLQLDDVMTLRKNLSGSFRFIGETRWVVDLTFQLNRALHGESVAGYHLVNLFFHLGAAVTLFFLSRGVIESLLVSWRIEDQDSCSSFMYVFVPLATAALFVCHPVQTQAVTYISQRYTTLATFLYLLSLLLYIRARLSGHSMKGTLLGGASFVAALLALQSKEIAFTLPCMALLVEAALFRGKLLKKTWFLLALLVLVAVIPAQVLLRQQSAGPDGVVNALQQASAEVQGLSRSDYFITQLRVIVTYLRLLILPIGQNLDYDYPIHRSLLELPVIASLIFHLVVAWLSILLLLRARRKLASGDGVRGVGLLCGGGGIVWLYLTLSVESSIIPIRDVIFEHRLYLPSAGMLLGITGLAASGAGTVGRRRFLGWLVISCCLALAAATVARNQLWNSQLDLWMDVVKKSPDKVRGHYLLGTYLARQARPDKAIPHLVRSLEIKADGNDAWVMLNSAVASLGQFGGRYNDGLKYQQSVFEVDPRHKSAWQALSYNNLGLAYEYLGNLRAAQVNFEMASLLDPSLDLAWLNQALNASQRRDVKRYERAMEKLSLLNPGMARSMPRIGAGEAIPAFPENRP